MAQFHTSAGQCQRLFLVDPIIERSVAAGKHTDPQGRAGHHSGFFSQGFTAAAINRANTAPSALKRKSTTSPDR